MRKPVPNPNSDTLPYWQGCARHELPYQQCAGCGHVQFPPRKRCTHCGCANPAWKVSQGTGSVFSFTVVHRPVTAAFKADTPYVVALVDWHEGFRTMANVLGCASDDVHIGMEVKVSFEAMEDSEYLLPQCRRRHHD